MASIASFNELLVAQMRDLYDAEKRLTKAIPKLRKAATNDELRSALENHLEETEGQITRLEQAFEHLGETPKAKPCAGMRGIIEEGDEHVKEDYDDDALRDADLSFAQQQLPNYPYPNVLNVIQASVDMLRASDANAAARIAVAPVPKDGLGEAINDRLRRAAHR